MALITSYTYSTHVTVIFYSESGFTLRCDDCGSLDDIHERVCEVLVKHGFVSADVCSATTGEVLMIVERT